MVQSVIVTRTALMQAVSDAVRVGYYWWCAGVVSPERATAWVRKAERYYAVDLDRNRRARAKARGEGCAKMFLHEDTPGELTWILVVTDGDHPAHKLEKLQDARENALKVFGYELVRMTRPGSAHPAWTWRMTRDTFEARRAEVIDTVRRGDDQRTRQLVHSLYAAPGFAGVRKQTGKLAALMRSEWSKRKQRHGLHLPSKLHYLERTRVDSMPLNVWLSKAQAQQT